MSNGHTRTDMYKRYVRFLLYTFMQMETWRLQMKLENAMLITTAHTLQRDACLRVALRRALTRKGVKITGFV